jgi:TolA-binding protein
MRYAAVAVLVLAIGLILWQMFGPGPRRRRALTRANRLLDTGSWQEALAVVQALRTPRLSEPWQTRLRSAAGECHQRAADEALKEKRFEDALEHLLNAAPLLGLDEGEQRTRVVEHVLAEARRLFAGGTDSETTAATMKMLRRAFALSDPLPEASFWQGLCLLREGEDDKARAALSAAHEGAGGKVIDPPFYLGVLLHRLGQPQEALRFLAEANRVDGNCPFVTWQMGVSLMAAGGDSGLALRALQRAMGARGLSMWLPHPERVWVEAFPEGRSYVRRLALKHRYVCPLLGPDLSATIRQGRLALAQAMYRQERFAESAEGYAKLLSESPPTGSLLRGYGLALARLQQYDQAYKQLRIALDQEEPKDPFTAGYLALCGAMGKPTNADDKPKNVAWAIRLMARYPVTGNAEWAGLLSTVFAEARSLDMPLDRDEQLLLCDTLASVGATDPQSAGGYAHLAATFPNAVRPAYAWLYTRAASTHGLRSPADLGLFALTFKDDAPAREFYGRQQWNFDEALYTFLQRSAEQAPGQFPEALGADYPPRGEAFLLARSQEEESAGRKDQAQASVEVLLRLAPGSTLAHDRLACLYYRRGNADRALALLSGWQKLAPHDHWPLVRQAIIEQERGNAQRRAQAIDRALGLTRGRLRAAVAFLGARLALREGGPDALARNAPDADQVAAFAKNAGYAAGLLEQCLTEQPDHVEALWCLAAVRSVLAEREALAALAARFNRPEVKDARFHFLGAVCHLAARDYPRVLELAQRATAEESLLIESQYVMAWAHIHLRDGTAARQALQKVAAADKSPSAPYARALLGHLGLARGDYDDGVKWWSAVDAARRAQWQLDDPLRQTVLLTGLLAFSKQNYDQAAERFREAGKLGLRDRRLGGLLTLALVKAGQRLLFSV